MMNLKKALIYTAVSLFTIGAQAQEEPNVLFIGFDDMRPLLGYYGDPVAHTPNLDRFAERAMRFTQAHVQQSVCAASRASFLTGCRPETTGVDYPYSDYFKNEFIKEHPTIMAHFMNNGYFVRTFGKIHHGNVDETFSAPEFSNWAKHRFYLPEYKKLKGRKAPPFEHADVPDDAYADGEVADQTILELRRLAAEHSGQPFFLATGFYKPHLPWTCPKKYYDLYKTEDMPLAKVKELPVNGLPWSTTHNAVNAFSGPKPSNDNILSDQRARELIHSYYACVSYVDAQFGKVIDELEQLGLMDSTVIMVWSDHGYHLGDQGMWGKSSNFYLDTHSPLMVYAPGMETGGRHCDALVEYVDMYPTLTELTGQVVPDYLEGTSLVPLLENPSRPWKSAAFAQYPRDTMEGFVIQTDRYRLIEWRERIDGGPVGAVVARELYDHKLDPDESRNLVDAPEYDSVVNELSYSLSKGWKAALPPGIENHSDNPLPPQPEKKGTLRKTAPVSKQVIAEDDFSDTTPREWLDNVPVQAGNGVWTLAGGVLTPMLSDGKGGIISAGKKIGGNAVLAYDASLTKNKTRITINFTAGDHLDNPSGFLTVGLFESISKSYLRNEDQGDLLAFRFSFKSKNPENQGRSSWRAYKNGKPVAKVNNRYFGGRTEIAATDVIRLALTYDAKSGTASAALFNVTTDTPLYTETCHVPNLSGFRYAGAGLSDLRPVHRDTPNPSRIRSFTLESL